MIDPNKLKASEVFFEDVRALFSDPAQLHPNVERAFRLALPPEMREAFTDPPAGTKAHAVQSAMFTAFDQVMEFVNAALDAADKREPVSAPTRFPASKAENYDDDFREKKP